jgi:hypothetical protein
MTFPMLADFALRLAFGLALMLLLTPWRLVPPAFFRTHCLVILGLLVLAGLDASRDGVRGPLLAAVVAAGVLAYAGAVTWGVGLPRVAVPVTALVALLCAAELVVVSRSMVGGLWLLRSASRLSSGFLLGATLTAMLLGHYYLTAPAMSIDPLKRFVRLSGWGLGVRAAVAGLALGLWAREAGSLHVSAGPPLFLAMRWGMGLLGPAVATVLAWKTVQIRSTQSATGILYIAMTLLLFGEMTAIILSRESWYVF